MKFEQPDTSKEQLGSKTESKTEKSEWAGQKILNRAIEHAEYMQDYSSEQIKRGFPKEEGEKAIDTYSEYVNILSSFLQEGRSSLEIRNPSDIIKAIDLEIASNLSTMNGIASEKSKEKYKKKLKYLEKTKDFVNNEIEKYKEENREKSKEKPVSYSQEEINRKKAEQEQKAEADKKEREEKIKEVMNNLEQQEQKELLEAVLKDGGIGLQIALPSEYHPNHTTGYTDVKNEKRLEGGDFGKAINSAFYNLEEYKTGERFKDIMEDNEINEVIALVPKQRDIEKAVQEKIVKPVWGGMRTKTETVTKMEKVGVQPILHSEVVDGGKKEPAYELLYKVFDDSMMHPQGHAYRETTNRNQIFELKITLPESEAKKVLEQIKKDPSFIREIAEKSVIEQLKIPTEAWEEGKEHNAGYPLRPPYEEWRKRRGGKSKIYFHEAGKPINLNNVKEF